MSLEKVPELMKMNTQVTFCKYGLNKNFLAPRYYGLSITDTKSRFRGCPLQRELTNQCSCLEFLTAIKWEIELKVKLACGVGKQNF